jgi:hypothetical protein
MWKPWISSLILILISLFRFRINSCGNGAHEHVNFEFSLSRFFTFFQNKKRKFTWISIFNISNSLYSSIRDTSRFWICDLFYGFYYAITIYLLLMILIWFITVIYHTPSCFEVFLAFVVRNCLGFGYTI